MHAAEVTHYHLSHAVRCRRASDFLPVPARFGRRAYIGLPHGFEALIRADVGQKCQRAVRRRELRKFVPLADTTLYEMERRGDFRSASI